MKVAFIDQENFGNVMTAMNSEARKKFERELRGDATPVSSPIEALILYQQRQKQIIAENRRRKQDECTTKE